MEKPAGAKPCQHTGQRYCKHTHTHMAYSNNAGRSPAFQTNTHTLNYSSKELWAAHTQTGRPAVALH